jgi:hypothetical protein
MSTRIDRLAQAIQKNPQLGVDLFCARLAANDIHELAIVIAARYRATGRLETFPAGSIPDRAQNVAQALVMGKEVVLGRKTEKGLVTDYDVARPSDEARRQMTKHREEQGMIHIGPRMVRPRRSNGVERDVDLVSLSPRGFEPMTRLSFGK